MMLAQAVSAWFAGDDRSSCVSVLSTRLYYEESMAKRVDFRTQLEMDLRRIAEGRHHDPHSLLGIHERDGVVQVLLYIPAARDVKLDGRFDAARLNDKPKGLSPQPQGLSPRSN